MKPLHRNLFDPLRILFAVLVILSHAVALGGWGESDWLSRHTGDQANFSYLGVRGFFVISGFLVYKSLLRSRNWVGFMKKRVLRIFPGLLVMLLAVTFIAGPLLSELPPGEYFRQAWRYPLSELRVFPVQRTERLPGVFSRNPYSGAVNGSLWTIWFELLFYAGLSLFIFIKKKKRLLDGLLVAGWSALFLFFLFFHLSLDKIIFPFTGMSSELVLDLLLYFAAGAALTLLPWSNNRMLCFAAILTGLLLAAAGLWSGTFLFLRYPALPLLVLGLGNLYWEPLAEIRNAGEPSYGIYIYAFPVQQALVQVLHPDQMTLTLLSIAVAALFGYASWHLVEKRFLAFGKTQPRV